MQSDQEETTPMGGEDAPGRTSLRLTRRTIGRYRLSYEIASGGQATVYVGVAEGASGFEKLVAIKVLHRHFTKDPATVAQFKGEARLAAQLTHPNVCGVIDFGIDGEDHFLVMEFIPGVTVAAVLLRASELAAEKRLDTERWGALAGLVLTSVAEGLHAVHDLKDASGRRLNVVHRDIAPKNIILGFDGSVRLMDFGIAKHDARINDSLAGAIKGTAAYMSPEQANGDPVDARSDIWALGVVAWEFLALRRLFKRPNPFDTVVALMSDPIPRLAELRSPLDSTRESPWSPAVDAALDVALVRDKSARTDDARLFASQLASAVGRASAAELAEWIRRALPHAEVESRTVVDLAHQSAGQLPSVAEAVEERRRHLAAIALHQSARGLLVDLERAIDEKREDKALDERLVECRMTLIQAAREWPDDPEIRASLDVVLRLAVQHELRRENAAGARALLQQMSEKPAPLETELSALEQKLIERTNAARKLETLAREHDLRVGLRARVASMTLLTLGAIAIAILAFTLPEAELTHPFLIRIAVIQLAVTLVGVVGFRKQLAANSAGRRIAALIVAIALSGFLQRWVGAWYGVAPAVILALDLVRHGLSTAAAGLIVPRTAWATVVPALALGITLSFPEETPRIVSISSVLTLVTATVLYLRGLGPSPADPAAKSSAPSSFSAG